MIDIVGHIKVTDEKRFKYLIASIRSYRFLSNHCKFILSVDGLTQAQRSIVVDELKHYEYLMTYNLPNDYGKAYCRLLDEGKSPFIINFMEDQFMLNDDLYWILGLMHTMETKSVEVCKASFFTIEQNSIKTIKGENTEYGLVYDNDVDNFLEYKKHYGQRYYLGVNFLTTRSFAYSFWNRDIKGYRPHPFEVCGYDKYFNHKCIVPSKEIQCAIDDEHGEKGTCLLSRNEDKFNKCMV